MAQKIVTEVGAIAKQVLLRKHVAQVRLDGLDIEIPQDHNHSNDGRKLVDTLHDRHDRNRDVRTVVVDNLVSTDARLVMITGKKDKTSRVWTIHALQHAVGFI